MVLAAIAAMLLLAAPSQASDGTWNRAWGKDVDSSQSGTGFEICTVAASCQTGSNTTALGGELNGPFAVATDAAGNVYVADTNNNRIQKFDSAGNFLLAWGKDVDSSQPGTGFEICMVAASCQAGSTGGLGGELNFPEGIATDGAGNVYVSDFSNNRIQKFDANGNFIAAWGKGVNGGGGFGVCTVAASCQAGSSGGLGGELQLPQGVATDAAGNNVYVADVNNQRIQEFDTSGNFERAWGKDVDSSQAGTGFEICTVAANCQTGSPSGALGGELSTPYGVATDAADNVYVSDQANQRIQKFGPAGNFLLTWGKDVDSSQAGTGFEICAVAASCQSGASSGLGGLGGEFDVPTGLASDGAGNVYVADHSNQRIQKFVEPPSGGGGEGGGPVPVPSPPVSPSNQFSFVGAAKSLKSGSARIKVHVPGPGKLNAQDAVAKRKKRKPLIKPVTVTVAKAGNVTLTLKPTNAARKLMAEGKRVRVTVKVTFTPTGGQPASRSVAVVLHLI